jgi:hypothetical protein
VTRSRLVAFLEWWSTQNYPEAAFKRIIVANEADSLDES